MFAMQFNRGQPKRAPHAPRPGRPLLAAAAFVALLAAGVSRPAFADEKTIEISNFSFVPAQLTVPAGTTVTWVNKDEEPHTVVESDTLFKSHALDTGDKFSFTFTTPGSFKYFCTIHAHMVGMIVVQ
jgi:plastocyanin